MSETSCRNSVGVDPLEGIDLDKLPQDVKQQYLAEPETAQEMEWYHEVEMAIQRKFYEGLTSEQRSDFRAKVAQFLDS